MAIIKTSALVADIKGKVGGNVFSRNKGGNYVRRYVKPINRNTAAQQFVRILFGVLASGWRNLTTEARTAWNTITVLYPYVNRLGEVSIYSGQQLYQKLNSNLNSLYTYQIGSPFVVDQLVVPEVPAEFPSLINGITLVNTTSQLIDMENVFINGSNIIQSGFALIVEATTSISTGVNAPQKGLFKIIGSLIEATDLSDSVVQQAVYLNMVAVFGDPVLNAQMFINVRLVSIKTGEASINVRASAQVIN